MQAQQSSEKNKRTETSIHFVSPSLFVSDSMENKKKTLCLVSTAGSAPTSTLKLPALGANVGPEGEKRLPLIQCL